MVPRYSRAEMTAIWSPENRYRIWWQIEVFAAEAMGRIGMIPAQDAATIRAAYDRDALGEIDIGAIDAIEAVTKHDVIAFLTWAGEKLGPERRWLHQGMTSSDVLDTALAVQLKQAADLLILDIDRLLGGLGDELASYGLQSYHHYETRTLQREMNWKLAVDTFCETYHLSYLHHDTISPLFYNNRATFDAFSAPIVRTTLS